MPIIRLSTVKPPTPDQRKRLQQHITEVVVQDLEVPVPAVNVLIEVLDSADWAVGGRSLKEIFAEQAHGTAVAKPKRVPSERFIESGGLRLAALEWPGIEPTVILVPGITSPAATWSFVVDALALPNRVLVLDVRGRGHSDAPHAAYTLDDYAADVHAWIEQLGLHQPILLGHSMGARIVAHVDAVYPRVAGKVIAVDPPLSGPGRAPYPFPLDFYITGIRKTRDGMTLEEMRVGSPTWSDEQLKDRLKWLPTCSEHAIAETYRLFHEEDFFDDWRKASAKSYLIRGANSPVVTAEAMDELKKVLPGGEYSTVPSAAHMIPWDNLPEFVDAMRCIVG